MFLRNCWYVAAWDHEVGRELKPVKILGEEIVLYRKSDGTAAALEDACPHRKLPLSMGRIKGDDVECGYHGLTFDCTGTCTRVPGAEKIPHVARVQSYPIAERYGLLWIWMGEAEKADPAQDLRSRSLGRPGLGRQSGRIHDARLQLSLHDRQSARSFTCVVGAPDRPSAACRRLKACRSKRRSAKTA